MANKYELLTIFSLKGNSEIEPKKEKVKNMLEKTGFKLTDEINEMGRRILAYPIKKQKEGFYWVPKIESNDNPDYDELNLLLKRDTDILKSMMIKLDEGKISRLRKKEEIFKKKKIEAKKRREADRARKAAEARERAEEKAARES